MLSLLCHTIHVINVEIKVLTQAFNKQVDFQAEAQEILREKTAEQEKHHFHHTLKGHDFIIPKNAAFAFADGGKLAFKKDEKFKKLFDYIMHVQKIFKQAEELAAAINADITAFNESVDRQNHLRQYKENGDIDALREMFINEYHINPDDVAAMSDEEIMAQSDEFDQQETLTQETLIESIKDKIQEFEKLLENGDLSQADREKLQQELDAIKQKAQNETGVDYDAAYAHANQSDRKNDKLYDLGREVNYSKETSELLENPVETNEANNSNTPPPSPGGFDF